jgi:hypothetical protein
VIKSARCRLKIQQFGHCTYLETLIEERLGLVAIGIEKLQSKEGEEHFASSKLNM